MTDTLEMTRPQAMETARRMHASGAWPIEHIRQYLAGRGHRVAWSQVKAWVDPDYDARRKARERIRMREAWREKYAVLPSAYKMPRDREDVLLALRVEDGLSYAAVAAVARRFYGVQVTESQMRYQLLKRGVEKNPNKARAQSERNRKAAA